MITRLNLHRFVIASLLYFTLCISATWLINPISFISFVAPAAAFVSGLILLWGTTAFVAVLFTSPFIGYCFYHYLGVHFELATILIAVLAIVLQGFWTKQLTYKFIFSTKWLKSRRWMLFFLLRLGPLASIISATAVVVIAILDNRVMQGSFLYTFLTSWSTSVLFSVFFIPLLLLIKENKQLNTSKKLFVSVISLLGGLATFLLFKASYIEQNHHRLDKFFHHKRSIERQIKQEIADVVSQVNSLSALFKAKEVVTLAEFTLFSQSILKENSSVRALEWAPIVTFENRKEFEESASLTFNQPFKIKERVNGQLLDSTKVSPYYAPLLYLYPYKENNSVLGLDVFSNAEKILSMKEVTSNGGILASAPLTLLQDEFTKPGVLFSTAVLAFQPMQLATDLVESPKQTFDKKLNLKQRNTPQDLQGFVIAVVQFSDFFQRLSKQGKGYFDFSIQDVTRFEPHLLFGKALQRDNRHVESILIDVYSRQWRIDIGEQAPWFAQDKSWQAWAILVGGTLGAFIFQLLILMMAAYSSELSQKVQLKTRALILAKEKSDQKSLAKTNFLNALNNELRIPLQVIKVFVEQLKQKGINNKQVTGILHSKNNIVQLLDTMMDLSEIESGTITVKSEPFDFYGFLKCIEPMLKANNEEEGKSIFLLINKDVPHYINGDELRIQKLLYVLTQSAQQIFVTDDLRLTIKLHEHKYNSASLFFIYSHQDDASASDSDEKIKLITEQGFSSYSTSMAMLKEVCELLQGSVNLGLLPSGGGVLSASIRVKITTPEQQSAHQALFFDEPTV